ncbi:hypothetical protein MMJ17_22070, partial [Bacillus spizizenii]|nr:hypothetical protein [Bacillus spizizenii]
MKNGKEIREAIRAAGDVLAADEQCDNHHHKSLRNQRKINTLNVVSDGKLNENKGQKNRHKNCFSKLTK